MIQRISRLVLRRDDEGGASTPCEARLARLTAPRRAGKTAPTSITAQPPRSSLSSASRSFNTRSYGRARNAFVIENLAFVAYRNRRQVCAQVGANRVPGLVIYFTRPPDRVCFESLHRRSLPLPSPSTRRVRPRDVRAENGICLLARPTAR